MAVDKRKWMQAAERLLKQGKLQAALTELQRAADSSPDDPLTLNRLGDLLARQGRNEDAIGYYRKIANHFAESGFFPKSAAIHKKILRIDPNNLESLVGLGELYLSQDLHGEARNYLLHAANQQVEAEKFDQAREIYEKLVEAEPEEPRHRVRLAETRAAAGDADGAGNELVTLGQVLLSRGAVAEAERVYTRAAELLPRSHGPLLGLSECMVADGREDEALAKLEEAASREPAPATVIGELACHYAQSGRSEEALTRLRTVELLEVATPTWLKLFNHFVDRGDAETLWSELDPLFQAGEKQNPEALIELLESLEEIEEGGHLPALERLYEVQSTRGETQGIIHALDSMVIAYRKRSMTDEANRALAKIEELAPAARAEAPPSKPESPAPARKAPAMPQAGRPTENLPLEAEAPAVPLNRSDEEFVAGRLTQADVLEKYGLQPQALEQVNSVTARFPGHVPGQEKRVELLRAAGDGEQVAQALVGLALARRAAGDNEGAVEAAAEAAAGELPQPQLLLLQQCRLIEGGEEPDASATEQTPEAQDGRPEELLVMQTAVDSGGEDSSSVDSGAVVPDLETTAVRDDPAPEASEPAPTPAPVDRPEEPGVDLVINFDSDSDPDTECADDNPPPVQATPDEGDAGIGAPASADEVPASSAHPSSHPSGSGRREPGPDMLEEIGDFIDRGSLEEAEQRIQALRTLGYSSEALDALGARIEAGRTEAPPEVTAEPESPLGSEATTQSGTEPDRGETDGDLDLSAIEAVLEDESLEEHEPVTPEEDPEQSIDEVFSSFKAAVKEQVDDEDHGTHYDLGIAYKEMGLVDESIAEFELSAKAPAFARRSCTMIAQCYRERQELPDAAVWYRKAIEAADGENREVFNDLRYALAEVLRESGDPAGALTEYRAIESDDPNYREVGVRIGELEEQVES